MKHTWVIFIENDPRMCHPFCMLPIERSLFKRISDSQKSVLLLGPRQVGKSTLARSLDPDRVINLADEALYIQYSKDPSRLRRELEAMPKAGKARLVLVDEIQRSPSLLNTVQSILDEGLPGGQRFRFLLTGSSARKLKRGGANLLPGRITLEYLFPMSFWEMGEAFNLERVLRVGSLPGIYFDEQQGEDVLGAYTSIYLREEIQAEALVQNIGAYARFLDMAAQSSGDWVNYSKLSSDTEIAKETLRRFFTILEETLVAVRVPPFGFARSKRRVVQREKFILFDMGVRNAVLHVHKQAASPVEKGRLFEQWFYLQCLAFNQTFHKGWQLSSFRTDTGHEVDTVIDLGSRLVAIECKYGKNVSESDMKGLRALASLTKKSVEKIVVCQGEKAQRFSGGEMAYPFQQFLGEILPAF